MSRGEISPVVMGRAGSGLLEKISEEYDSSTGDVAREEVAVHVLRVVQEVKEEVKDDTDGKVVGMEEAEWDSNDGVHRGGVRGYMQGLSSESN